MKINEMSQEDLYKHYQWTLDHEEKLKKLFFNKLASRYKVGEEITDSMDIETLDFIREQLTIIFAMRKAILKRLEVTPKTEEA